MSLVPQLIISWSGVMTAMSFEVGFIVMQNMASLTLCSAAFTTCVKSGIFWDGILFITYKGGGKK